jgi:hypothetical protein
MKRVIGMDIRRTFAEVVFWEDGQLHWHGRVDMTRSGLEGFGRGLTKEDEVVVEATGNAWHLLTKAADYLWARPALVAQKLRSLELQAGRPMRKGNRRGPAYAYNVKELRDREKAVAEQAEHAYEQLVAGWCDRPRRRTTAANAAGHRDQAPGEASSRSLAVRHAVARAAAA